MSNNEVLDDPMDTEVPEPQPAEPISEANNGGQEEVETAVIPQDEEREETPMEMVSKGRQVLDLISNSLGGLTGASTKEEKRVDKENFDEKNDLNVTEPVVDVESIGCLYSGNALFVRGRFIAKHCPPLRADMYCTLINHLRENTKDVTHYQTFFNELEAELSKDKINLNANLPIKDSKWMEETLAVWSAQLDSLQADYKRHKDEGVKESTRRAMEDLFQHFVSAGRIEDAIRLYSRGIRDYCTQLKHSINMWLNWIEVSIMANDWSRVDTVTSTAFRSLKDADDADKSQNTHQRGENATYVVEREVGHSSSSQPSITNRQLIENALAKVLAATSLSKLRNKSYSQVVETILRIKTENLQPKWFVTTSDLGIYALLCAMATMERNDLRTAVTGTSSFRKLLESEPIFIELIGSYASSRFGRCFEILGSVKSRLQLDPFVSREVETLFRMIRQKCVIQYLQPYSTIKISTMCTSLGTTIPELQKSLVELIETKGVNMKIDQKEGILRMYDGKDEETTLRRVNDTCDKAILRAKSLLWKSTLASANIHSISEKESRQKRKKDKEFLGRYETDEPHGSTSGRSPRPEGSSSFSHQSDDFNVAFEGNHHAYLEDLDIDNV